MPRTPKLSKIKVGKHTYWSTKTGGRRVYFGNVKEVTRKDAEKAFLNHRQEQLEKPTISRTEITAGQLIDEYLDWAKANLSADNCGTKRSCLAQFANHRVGSGGQEQFKRLPGCGKQVASLSATQLTAAHLSDFLEARKTQPARPGMSPVRIAAIAAQLAVDDRPGKINVNTAKRSALIKVKGLGLRLVKRLIDARPIRSMVQIEDVLAGDGEPVGQTILAALMVHIKACWNWGADNHLLPESYRPFAKVPKIKIPKRPKHESELPTRAEYEAILKWADYDLAMIRGTNGRYRQRTPEECRQGADNPYAGFGDLIRCYYAVGPRTSELAKILVKDVSLRKGQIVLTHHKRSKTMTDDEPRILTLDAATVEIFKRHCQGKRPDELVFTQHNGRPWNKDRLDNRFAQVRKLAGVRDNITIYSFRHLWITDAMESGIELGSISAMAGTSMTQIEATYGHVRSEAKSQAQATIAAHRAKKAG